MSKEMENNEVLCGIGNFRPKWLQILNNPKAMCAFLSVYMFLHGFIILGVHSINTTTFERRFQLSSAQIGWASSTNDLSAAIFGVFISFYGAKRYKARWLASSVAVGVVGNIMIGLPHFLTGLYQWGQDDESICRRRDSAACSEVVEIGVSRYFYLLLFGTFLIGISGATLLTVGISYIDDSVPSNSSPVYRGIIQCMLCVGLAAGYGIGGQTLKLYVDFEKVSTDGMIISPQDPRWVGAWWLSYYFVAFLYLFLFIVFGLYGSELPSAGKLRKNKDRESTVEEPVTEQSYTESDQQDQNQVMMKIDTINQHVWHTNAKVSGHMNCYKESGKQNEKTKANVKCNDTNSSVIQNINSETEDNVNNRKVDQLAEFEFATSPAGLNYREDGYVKKKSEKCLNMDRTGTVAERTEKVADEMKSRNLVTCTLKILRSPVFVFLTLANIGLLLVLVGLTVFFPKVVQNQFNQTAARSGLLAGAVLAPGAAIGQLLGGFVMKKLSLQIRGSLILSILTTGAAMPLILTMLVYCEGRSMAGWGLPYYGSMNSPVLDLPDFFSGCNNDCSCRLDLYEPVCDSNQTQYFSPCFAGCSVVQSSENRVYSNCSCLQNGNSSSVVTADACHYGCDKLNYALPLLLVCLMFGNCLFIPVQTVLLRIHNEADKTFALGLMWLFVRVFGQIPGPIILGAALDDTCVIWGETCHEDKTSCWVYDNKLLARNLTMFTMTVTFGILVMLILAFIFYQRSIRKEAIQANQKEKN